MKKFAVSFFVLALTVTVFGTVFARSNNDPTGANNGKDRFEITMEDLAGEDQDGNPLKPQGNNAYSVLQSRVAVAASNVLADEVANVVLDNSGNYTFFKKQGSNAGDIEDRVGLTMYIKAFGGMEKLDMKDYTKFETNYYGAVVGLDTDRKYGDNFDATYGLFVSYAGSQLKEEDYDDDKFSANSGFAGVRGNWYIGKLFFGAVLDYGYMANKVEYKGGRGEDYSKDYNIQSIGFAAKAGYNFEVVERSFTIQPNVVFNSNYLITEEYSSYDMIFGNEAKVKADNIIDIAVAPGLKLAKTLGKCWIISAEGKYVFVSSNGDIKLETDYASGTLPETYYKDYVSCGLGVEKIWGYTVLHLKGHKTFCGRDGYVVNAGIEFKF